ncbi:MAG: methyltransferase domain-containing protein [Acidimicrobiia bacterium]
MAATQATDAALRTQVHTMWAQVADGWAEHAEYVDSRGAHLTARMIDASAPKAGDRVLELACGPGGAGLAIAEIVGTTGEVVLSDVATEMIAIAAARAADRGLDNVRTTVRDLEQIDEPDASFDVVVCREGLMFAVQPARAVAEIARVLRPGGRVALAVWGPRADNPWLGLVFDAVSEQLGLPIPPPGVPGPFALSDATELHALLVGGGLVDVSVEPLSAPLRAASFDEWWARTSAIAGPLAAMLASLPDEVRCAITDRLRAAVEPYRTAEGLEIPGVTLLASARHP